MRMRDIIAVGSHDMKRFQGNPFLPVMTFLVPILYFVVLGNALGGTMNYIPVGVVQDGPPYEPTPLFTHAANALNHVPPVDPKLANAGKPLDVTVYSDESQARRDLLDGKVAAVIVFPSSVSSDPTVRLYLDSSDRQRPPQIQAAVKAVLLQLGAKNPVTVSQVYGDIMFTQYFGLGLAMMVVFTSGMSGGAVMLIRDRENATRGGYHQAAPHSCYSSYFGILTCSVTLSFITGFIIILLVLLSGLPYPPDLRAFLISLFVLLIACIAITSGIIFVATWIPSQVMFSSIMPVISLCLYMTSGAIFPVSSMPDWLRSTVVINPESYGVDALRGVILRNQGINVIGADLVFLLVFSAVMITLGIVTYRRSIQ